MKFTRRKFLRSALGTPIAAGLLDLEPLARLGLLSPVLSQSQAPVATTEIFPKPHDIRYDAHCFTVRDHDTFLFSASMHYPRSPRGVWRDRLTKLKRAGFNTIETYVFWNYHEPEEGRADLSEFDAFVQLAGEMGFWLIARPGPYVCAEWDAGGFPHWVIAKRFPLRSNDPESVRTSRHWFDLVLPAIRRRQITNGGPIILMQIENEYDYWDLPDPAKREYVTALSEMAWNAGIEIPLITCWTKQVRERGNPAMARIADFCNFYPRWKIVQEVIPGLATLRKEEPVSPLGVTELQGGWFSEDGGKVSSEQEGLDPAQMNMLSKTVIEQGATFFNYYMGFGGTNFDWAAKGLTTTYDYAAPLREPGGLWGKYYEARGIGESLRILGSVLTRAQETAAPPESNNSAVSVSLRVNGKSGVLFVRENAEAEQLYKISLPFVGGPSTPAPVLPSRGDLLLAPRQMKMLPVEVPVSGGLLRYTTAEVLAHGVTQRPYLILYDEPDASVEFSLRFESEPKIQGETEYHEWDQAERALVVGMRTGEDPKILLLDERMQVILLPRDLALRTWVANFTGEHAGAKATNVSAEQAIFISDAALLREAGNHERNFWADLEFPPGERDLSSMLPARPTKCLLNGIDAKFSYDDLWQISRVHVHTPALPVSAITIEKAVTWAERFDPQLGRWTATELRPLEELGPIPYGYVKYHANFEYLDDSDLALDLFADDGAKVFVNGKFFAEVAAARGARQVKFQLANAAKQGANALDISYELFGSPNFGPEIAELKGVQSISLVRRSDGAKTAIRSWQVQTAPAAMLGREIDPNFPPRGWEHALLAQSAAGSEILPEFTWCRAEFAMDSAPANWQIPWKVHLEAFCDALLYLNGKFVGRYVVIGPQNDFYLPEPYLRFGGKSQNVLTIVLAYAESAAPIRALRIEPFSEFALHRTRVAFES